MYIDWIDVFYVVYGDVCVIVVMYDFVFDFFKVGNVFFYKVLIDWVC